MPIPDHFAHWVGVAGELLNFAGAVVMARDLFVREKEQAEARRLRRLGAWGKKHGLGAVRKGVPVNADDFAEKVLGRRASRLAYWGVGLLGLGFLFLLAYHLIAIYHGE
ncbi:MAG TPA: hypothetical protein VKG79_09560 [Bryobacteraceae bacterium]|nr:hypothetical protein [Bryobacteraceae bacterium]